MPLVQLSCSDRSHSHVGADPARSCADHDHGYSDSCSDSCYSDSCSDSGYCFDHRYWVPVVIITWVGLPIDSLESIGRLSIDSRESIGTLTQVIMTIGYFDHGCKHRKRRRRSRRWSSSSRRSHLLRRLPELLLSLGPDRERRGYLSALSSVGGQVGLG